MCLLSFHRFSLNMLISKKSQIEKLVKFIADSSLRWRNRVASPCTGRGGTGGRPQVGNPFCSAPQSSFPRRARTWSDAFSTSQTRGSSPRIHRQSCGMNLHSRNFFKFEKRSLILIIYQVLALAKTLLQGSRRHLTVVVGVVVVVIGTILLRPRYIEIYCMDFHSD